MKTITIDGKEYFDYPSLYSLPAQITEAPLTSDWYDENGPVTGSPAGTIIVLPGGNGSHETVISFSDILANSQKGQKNTDAASVQPMVLMAQPNATPLMASPQPPRNAVYAATSTQPVTPWYDENGVVNEENGVSVPIGPAADDPNYVPHEATIDFDTILSNSQKGENKNG